MTARSGPRATPGDTHIIGSSRHIHGCHGVPMETYIYTSSAWSLALVTAVGTDANREGAPQKLGHKVSKVREFCGNISTLVVLVTQGIWLWFIKVHLQSCYFPAPSNEDLQKYISTAGPYVGLVLLWFLIHNFPNKKSVSLIQLFLSSMLKVSLKFLISLTHSPCLVSVNYMCSHTCLWARV